jgi:hypothetical protein
LLVENETIVSLNLPELADGDADLLDRMELICLCPLLPNSELEALLVQHPRRVPDMIAHRRPAPTPVGVFMWVLTERVPLSLGFASINK